MRFILYITIILSLSTISCGYKPTFMVASIFPSPDVTVGITEVKNSTLITNLPYHLRSALYNTITNRKLALWRMDPPMQYEMYVEIISYRTRPRTVIEDDIVLLYNASLELAITIYDSRTAQVFWRSGTIETEHTYNTFEEDAIVPDLTLRAVKDIVDAMQVAF